MDGGGLTGNNSTDKFDAVFVIEPIIVIALGEGVWKTVVFRVAQGAKEWPGGRVTRSVAGKQRGIGRWRVAEIQRRLRHDMRRRKAQQQQEKQGCEPRSAGAG